MLNTAAGIIINKKGKFLLQLRDATAPVDANCWTLFSGRIEKKETAQQALMRELEEELHIQIEDARFFKTYRKYILFKRYIFIVPLTIKEPIKVTEGREGKYFSKEELDKIPLADHTRRAITDYLQKVHKKRSFHNIYI